MGSMPWTPAGIKFILCYSSLERGAVADVLGVLHPLGLALLPGSVKQPQPRGGCTGGSWGVPGCLWGHRGCCRAVGCKPQLYPQRWVGEETELVVKVWLE